MRRIRVLLGEDADSLREAVQAVLRVAADIEIAGEVRSLDTLASVARDLTADVVLVAQGLPPGDTLAAIRAVKQARPELPIIVMTDRLDGKTAPLAIEAGAVGYVLKDIPGANLAAAIRSVVGKHGALRSRISGKLAQQLSGLIRRHGWDRGKTRGLTGRELDILKEVASGRTDDEIAAQFVVTPGTIKTHIRRILRKISARNRAQAVAYVLRNGLIK